ncbi:MAG: Fe-S cluster assembly protein SufD [Acaryochloridaceae cyanobacterium SU_2_1]|nr:Fe-S cluster assembly protein SufD [Acaryochloridaceae cyanobacterium SU_2_1]
MTLHVASTDTVEKPMSGADQDRQAYLAKLLAQRSPDGPSWLGKIRDRALSIVQERGLPSNRDEDWRFTDLSGLYKTTFAPAAQASLHLQDIESLILADAPLRLVFVNGFYAPALSAVDHRPVGLSIHTLVDAAPLAQLGQQQGMTEVFTALNTANFEDVVVIQVAKHQIIETPIHLLFLTTGEEPTVTYPRGLIVAEDHSAVTLIEEYAAVGADTYFTNAVTEVWVGQNAQVHHHRIQREAKTAFHIGKTAVSQDRDSCYSLTSLSLGGQMSRHNPLVIPTGEQTDTRLQGLTLAVDQQVADTHSDLSFTGPHCTAQQLHKCIVDDRARAVFNGKIFVPKLAQQTNASQLSRNLLLSTKARVDTKPQLEIIADDVKCAHGATVSQLDDEEVFYLQSRGLDRDSACDLLVEGFAAEIIEQLPIAQQRQRLLDAVLSEIR